MTLLFKSIIMGPLVVSKIWPWRFDPFETKGSSNQRLAGLIIHHKHQTVTENCLFPELRRRGVCERRIRTSQNCWRVLDSRSYMKRSYRTKTVREPVKVHVSDTVDSLGPPTLSDCGGFILNLPSEMWPHDSPSYFYGGARVKFMAIVDD